MSHRWKLFIAVAVVMLALTGVWLSTMRLGPSTDVEAYKKSLMAKGEKLEISEVTPPPVPPEQNGADVVKEAFGLLNPGGDNYGNAPLAMLMVAPGKAMVCFEQPEIREIRPNITNSWSNVMDMVEMDRPATELLRQAMNYPTIDFRLNYETGRDTLLPHLAPMKRCVQRLSLEAMCDLHEGDTGSATTNLCAILALANGWQDERFLISQMVRMAMTSIAAEPTWELLQSTNVNDAELAMLQKSWERLEFIHPMENTILMERAINEITIKKMRASNEYFNRMTGGFSAGGGGSMDFWDNVKFAGAKMMWQSSWSYSDELGMLQNDQISLETIRTIETNGFFNPAYSNMLSRLDANEPTNDPSWTSKIDDQGLQHMFSEGVYSRTTFRRTMMAEVTRQVVVTAIALKRHHLEHGNYPENLDALVPDFLPSVPLDPVDGQPLRYRLNADGTFVLYSIGPNGRDDGGDPSLEPGVTGSVIYWLNPHALDWVWPQPATAAEIQYYYAHPPK